MNTFLENRKFLMKDTMLEPTVEQQRSGIALENLQEILDAEDNAGWTVHAGAAQYLTPESFANDCIEHLRRAMPVELRRPETILDPQCGEGALLNYPYTNRYGIDIDNRLSDTRNHIQNRITAHCVKVMEAFDDVYPDTRWDWIVANPPFSKRWKMAATGKPKDSTEFTWQWMIAHGNAGFLIANATTIEKLGIRTHPYVFDYTEHENVWPGVNVTVGVVYWKHPAFRRSSEWEVNERWSNIEKIVDAEKHGRPDWNIYLDHNGILRTYLSLRHEVKLKLTKEQIVKLGKINKVHPLTLTTEKESRTLLKSLVDAGIYTIQPEARKAIDDALAQVSRMAVPLLPVTDFERVAYADEEDALVCIADTNTRNMRFTAGRSYPLRTGTYKFTREYKRRKPHYNEKTGENYIVEHECELTGQDRYIAVRDDSGREIKFMESPQNQLTDREESLLWTIFKKPDVPTVLEAIPETVQHYTDVLKGCEMLAGYEYYPGQLTFIPRVAVKDQALVGSAVGTGKTLIALSLLACKGPERCLIIAPQGCVRSEDSEDDEDGTDYQASQWISEINKFAPYMQIWELFSMDDYHRICALNGGKLPPGVYVTYYDGFFRNKARETAPPTWDDVRLTKELNGIACAKTQVEFKMEHERRFWCDTIGQEKEGIRCIVSPSMSTQIGTLFDMVLLDEAHICTNLDATVTQMLLRLQPKYRYAFTATPIPNVIVNLFSLMGWICVDDWYKGGRRNARWPFARSDVKFFESTFMCMERDFTQENMNRAADPTWKGKCIRKSPVISAPARLLKLLKPSMAYAGKRDMNPDYKDARLIDVRVEMGAEQSKLYAHFLDRGNIPASNALVRARKQVAWLRGICADPKGFYLDKPKRLGLPAPEVHSNMNPKVIATLELTRDILAQGEQVLIISSRVGLSDTIQDKLVDAGIPVARIDSTVPADQHAMQSNLFKARRVPVLIMGIKCAMAHSFPQCIYEIITSIEYSPGPLNQAKGRIDRVNSRPGVTAYCILHKFSIEELMFDVCAVKDDAATICLLGKRVPRDFKPVDPREILANAIDAFDLSGATPEPQCEARWPALRHALKAAVANYSIPQN